MASLTYTGYERGNNLKQMLQQFYGNAKDLTIDYNGQIRPLFQHGPNLYPLFIGKLSRKSSDRFEFSFYVKEKEEETEKLLGSTPIANPENPSSPSLALAYRCLSQYTGQTWPWGALNGIRPGHVVEGLMENYPVDLISSILEEKYLVSEAKAKLAVETGLREKLLLEKIPRQSYGIYIGVPFCPTRCAYCSFTTPEGIGQSSAKGASFLDQLDREVTDFIHWPEVAVQKRLGNLEAVYIGGGTPGDFSEADFDRLVQIIRKLPLGPATEITMEMGRADVFTRKKLQILKEAGIHRICLNPQSLDDGVLERIGRPTSAAEIIEAYRLSKEEGMAFINLDFILGLPGETENSFIRNIEEAIRLNPESITIHSLALKRGSDRYREFFGQNVKDTNPLEAGDMDDQTLIGTMDKAYQSLRQAGYKPYYLYRHRLGLAGLENLSWAKPGQETLYNILMMSDRYPVLSFGTPAISKRVDGGKAKRLANPKSLSLYLRKDRSYWKEKMDFMLLT